MANKNVFITIIFLCLILIFQMYNSVADNTQKNNTADLELITFESWWSHLNNGTMYIRFLVINKGQTYHNPEEPFILNISLTKDTNETPFSYINQQSFLDPYTWFIGETLGGCYQIFNTSKPITITADVNFNHTIPETNMENNQKTTNVSNSIIIHGNVTKRINNTELPVNSITIRRCNTSSLQSSLYISFSTNETGYFVACLYPNQLSKINDSYTLLFIDSESSKTIVKDIFVNSSQQIALINITFPQYQLHAPIKPIGCFLGIKNFQYTYRTILIDKNYNKISYKFQWDQNSYSPWLDSNGSIHFIKSKHAWDKKGIYNVKILAKNDYDLISSWSNSLLICII